MTSRSLPRPKKPRVGNIRGGPTLDLLAMARPQAKSVSILSSMTLTMRKSWNYRRIVDPPDVTTFTAYADHCPNLYRRYLEPYIQPPYTWSTHRDRKRWTRREGQETEYITIVPRHSTHISEVKEQNVDCSTDRDNEGEEGTPAEGRQRAILRHHHSSMMCLISALHRRPLAS